MSTGSPALMMVRAIILRAGRQCHCEAASSLAVVAHVPAVAAGDLPHQGQAEPRALRAGSSRNAVEPREQLLACGGVDRRSAIGHAQRGTIGSPLDGDLDRRRAVELRIL